MEKVKLKGCFSLEPGLHQDNSMKIVAKAVYEHFVNGIPIEKTINECNDISMFLMGARAKTGKFFMQRIYNGEIVKEPLPKHIRYYMGGSNVLMKTDSNTKNVHKGFTMTMFNDWVDAPYNVDKRFYIKQANKLVNSIETQGSLI